MKTVRGRVFPGFGVSATAGVILAAAVYVFCRQQAGGGQRQPSPADRPGRAAARDPSNEDMSARSDHSHRSFGQRRPERLEMVAKQIAAGGVEDPNVLEAIRTVPRHAFVRSSDSFRAYGDHPLAIGLGQTISQPYIVGYMTQALGLDPNSVVLEIGTGSGYQAAVCAEIAQRVYTVEIIEKLANAAAKRLDELGYGNVFVKAADGYNGWPEKGPFDAIIVTCAAAMVPPPLIEQLAPDGRMILPLGSPFAVQWLILVTKDNGDVRSRSMIPVQFVPMVARVRGEK